MSWGHLAGRFVRALWPLPPARRHRRWVARVLQPDELALWRRLPRHDQRHSVAVGRRLARSLTGTEHGGRPGHVAAALLHDVGKLEAGLGIMGRVAATLVARAFGVGTVARWAGRPGLRGRAGAYVTHGELGGAMIRAVGGREEAAHWAEVHHRRDLRDRSHLPREVVEALHRADAD